VADNTTAEGRALNRRVEIKITPVTTDDVNAAK
jgi:outer membrane protein OmpA-like peptidoglycan-associated protein